jgi:hypothetical protein
MHAAQAAVWFWCLIMANPTMEKFLHARHQQLDSKSNYKNLSPEGCNAKALFLLVDHATFNDQLACSVTPQGLKIL